MLGIALLAVAIILFFIKKWQYLSYFLYIGFLTDGYKITINPILGGLKNMDLAIVYSLIITSVLIITHHYRLRPSKISTSFWWLCIFIISSFIFPMIYYKISFFEVLQGGRFMLLVLCYPILVNMSMENVTKLLYLLAWFTVWMAFLDVLQIVFQHPMLPVYALHKDSALGVIRFFNYPPFIIFYLIVAILDPSFYGKKTKLIITLFVICILGTLARSLIFITGITILLALYFIGKQNSIIKYGLLICLVSLPFLPILSERFGGDTSSDISNVLTGRVELQSYEQQNDGNFTYRISWVIERVLYLVNRPLEEQFFGLGLLSDSSPLSIQMYQFIVNIKFYGSGMIQQLRSPDIAYGTMLAYYGFGGIIIYLCFLWQLFKEFYRTRHKSPFYIAAAVWILFVFMISVFSDDLSSPSTFALCFIMLAYKNKIPSQKMSITKD